MINKLTDKQLMILVVAGLIIFFVLGKEVKDLFKSLNPFAKSDEEEKGDKKIKDSIITNPNKNYWTPRYWQDKSKTEGVQKILTKATAEELAKRLWDSISWYPGGDDIAKAEGVFKNLLYKTQVSFLADTFQKLYKKDMLSFLIDKLDTKDQKEALNRILTFTSKLN
jgi:hypothetical protein